MSPSTPSGRQSRLHTIVAKIADEWNRIGSQAQFYSQTVRGIGDAFVHYKVELVRLIAQIVARRYG